MISVHQLTKRFATGREELTAVDGLTFSVSGGEVYGLLGPNGAGKATTLRMILGLIKPDGGWAEVAGFRTSEAPDEVKRRIGFVSASAGLYQWLTAREMLLFFADIYGLPPHVARRELERVAEVLDLNDYLNRRCGVLSTGQRQRVNLARAMIHNPPIMLLDEPTRGLDVLGTQEMFDYISHLRREGKAVIVTTHRLDEAERLCDRFGLMHRGRLAGEGTLDELRRSTGYHSLAEIFLKRMSGKGG
jgi:ABC-2 type transport system ATP-binding protein/sodium transport system ATP-binding protein